MDKIQEAQIILKEMGLPAPQQNQVSALTLLALCNIKPDDKWSDAERKSMTLATDIMEFVKEHYEIGYKSGSRESFRKSALNPFVTYGIVEKNPDNPHLPPSSSLTHYAISSIALATVKKFGSDEWEIGLDNFLKYKNSVDSFDKLSKYLLEEIHIKGFKSIADDKIKLGRFNVFIGANGCGKSNILEALATVGADCVNDVSFDGLSGRGVRLARPNLILSSFINTTQRSSIDINLQFAKNDIKEEYKCSLTPTNPSDIYTKWINLADEELYPDTLLKYFGEITNSNPGISGNDLLNKANELITNRGLKPLKSFSEQLSSYVIYDINTKSLRGISSNESKKTPLGLNGEGLDLLIDSFNIHQKSLLSKCLSFFDWLSEIVTDKDDKLKLLGLKPGRSISTLYFRDRFMRVNNNILSAENSNEGVLHVLFYLALFISNKTPSLFGIDNIETALNPRLCQILIPELVKLSKETGKQVLVTTQNPAILDGLNLLDDEQCLFEVSRNSKGETRTRQIKFKNDLSDKKHKLSEMWLNGSLGGIPQNF